MSFAYEGQIAETVTFNGDRNDRIEGYAARPMGAGPFPGVVVIHHNPGWDEWSKEVVRKFAHHGYSAIAPHLFSRLGPGSSDDLAAKSRAAGVRRMIRLSPTASARPVGCAVLHRPAGK